jgi:hypothetical protein
MVAYRGCILDQGRLMWLSTPGPKYLLIPKHIITRRRVFVGSGMLLSRTAKSGPLAPSSVAVASWKAGCLKQGPVVEAGVDVGRVLHDLTWSRPRPLSTEAQDWWPGDIARSYRHRSANSPFEYVRNELLTLLSTTCARVALAPSLPCIFPQNDLSLADQPGTRSPHKPTACPNLSFRVHGYR